MPTLRRSLATQALALVLLLLALALGCTTTRGEGAISGMGGIDDEVTSPEINEAVRGELESAQRDFAAGKLDAARDAFALTAATHPNTTGGELAGVFVAVVDAHTGEPGASAELLRAAEDEDLPAGTRALALSYHALGLARAGSREESLDALAALYPGNAPSPLLPRADALDTMTLLSEARAREDNIAGALVALSWLFQLGEGAVRDFASARGLALGKAAWSRDRDAIAALARHDDDFVAAISGASLVIGATSGPIDDSSRALLAELGEDTADKLLRIDCPRLSSEVELRLTRLSGKSPLRIGALLPLSGKDKRVGQSALAGLMLAVRTFRPGANPRVTLVVEDTRSSVAGAERAFARLRDKGVLAIVGPLSNDEAKKSAELANDAGLPIVTLSLDAALSDADKGVFRFFVDNAREVDALMFEAGASGRPKLAVLYPDLAFGKDILALVDKAASAHDVEIVARVPYAPDSRNFSRQAAKIRKSGATSVFIPDVASRVSLLMPFLAAEQLWCAPPGQEASSDERRNITCLGNVTWFDKALLRDGGSYFEGAIVVASYATLARTDLNDRFLEEHRAMVGGAPDLFAAFAFDAFRLLERAILEKGLGKPGALIGGLTSVERFGGLTGNIVVAPSGEVIAPPVVLQVHGGEFAPKAP